MPSTLDEAIEVIDTLMKQVAMWEAVSAISLENYEEMIGSVRRLSAKVADLEVRFRMKDRAFEELIEAMCLTEEAKKMMENLH